MNYFAFTYKIVKYCIINKYDVMNRIDILNESDEHCI